MENATKALIIAGSILIAIILIAIGVKILNSTQGVTDSAEETMKSADIADFNSKFTAYSGKQAAAEVKALANKVIATNSVSEHQVTFNGKTDSSMITNMVAEYTGLYQVSFNFNDKGYIDAITVTLIQP